MTSGPINEICWNIGNTALQGILLEVTSFPKPGLVTPLSNGAHNDMNLQTFMLSSAAIAPCFSLCAQQGFNHQAELSKLLDSIRPIGIYYEQKLLTTTHGINTQRGILFSASVFAAAAGYLSAQGGLIDAKTMGATIAEICHGICAREFAALKKDTSPNPAFGKKLSAGEQLFLRYGTTGIRGEAEQGFPAVIAHGLPALQAALDAGVGLRLACSHALLALMAHCEDSTVLWRGGMEALTELKMRAAQVLQCGGMLSVKGMQAQESLSQFCLRKNLSPGGAADLLALTLAIHIFTHEGILNEIF